MWAACREREKQRVQELSSTLHNLSARVQEQATQDAETELLERESEELQQLSRELDAELAAIIQQKPCVLAKAESNRPESPPSPLVTRSSGETSQGSLQSSSIPCSMADPMQQHHTMYEAYEFLVRPVMNYNMALSACSYLCKCIAAPLL